jgi:hypothetical protein
MAWSAIHHHFPLGKVCARFREISGDVGPEAIAAVITDWIDKHT